MNDLLDIAQDIFSYDYSLTQLINITTFLGIIVAYFWKIRPLMRKGSEFFEDWFGERPRKGMVPRPGVMERLSLIGETLDEHNRRIRDNTSDIDYLKTQVRRLEVLATPVRHYEDRSPMTGPVRIVKSIEERNREA